MRLTLVPVLALFLVGCGLIDQVNGPSSLVIQRFVASPDDVSSGASVTLTWDVQGAEAVQIDNGVGTVPAKGTKTFPAYHSATYTLTAKAGTSAATASVQVSVKGTASDPFVFLQPTPTPSPEPGASPSPSPDPSTSPSPGGEADCGTPVELTGSCKLEIEHPVALPAGECIELVALSPGETPCPIESGQSIKVKFDVTAQVGKPIHWKSDDTGKDKVTPDAGPLQASGTTNVKVTDKVVGNALHVDVMNDDGDVYLRFSLRHQ